MAAALGLSMLKGGGGGALGGMAASMFKPKDVAKAAVGSVFKAAVQSTGVEKKIDWDKYNCAWDDAH